MRWWKDGEGHRPGKGAVRSWCTVEEGMLSEAIAGVSKTSQRGCLNMWYQEAGIGREYVGADAKCVEALECWIVGARTPKALMAARESMARS